MVPTVFLWNYLARVGKCQDSSSTGLQRLWSTRDKMAAAGFYVVALPPPILPFLSSQLVLLCTDICLFALISIPPSFLLCSICKRTVLAHYMYQAPLPIEVWLVQPTRALLGDGGAEGREIPPLSFKLWVCKWLGSPTWLLLSLVALAVVSGSATSALYPAALPSISSSRGCGHSQLLLTSCGFSVSYVIFHFFSCTPWNYLEWILFPWPVEVVCTPITSPFPYTPLTFFLSEASTGRAEGLSLTKTAQRTCYHRREQETLHQVRVPEFSGLNVAESSIFFFGLMPSPITLHVTWWQA